MARKIDTDAVIAKVRVQEQSSHPSTPDSGYGWLYELNNGRPYLMDDGGIKRQLRDNTGWVADENTWSFLSADSPSFVASVNANITGSVSVGMKTQLTHGGSDKFFIVTSVSITGSTSYVNLYGGTDYSLSAGAITNPKYSPEKTPFGFPPSPAKWTVSASDTTDRQQASPVQNTWYNLGSVSISIPIGVWYVSYQVTGRSDSATPRIAFTLSTANNSESDTQFTAFSGASATLVYAAVTRSKLLTLTSKTSYFLNTRTTQSSASLLQNPNDLSPALISAVCAYL